MIPLSDQQEHEWRKTKVIAWALGLLPPPLYIIIATLVETDGMAADQTDLTVYILLALGILDPLLVPVIERFQVKSFRSSQRTATMTPSQFFTSLTVVRLAFANATFVYGMVVYLLSGSIEKMLWFYPVGIIWLIILWPRRAKFEKFVQESSG